jgi:hypothetical protein
MRSRIRSSVGQPFAPGATGHNFSQVTATILVMEDDPVVTADEVLRANGYKRNCRSSGGRRPGANNLVRSLLIEEGSSAVG